MTFTELHVNWSVNLADWLGPEIFNTIEIKVQVLNRARLHSVKVPGWFSDLNAFLTRKLPMFSSRLKEISGGIGNICLVSSGLRRTWSFWEGHFWLRAFVWQNPKTDHWSKITNIPSYEISPSDRNRNGGSVWFYFKTSIKFVLRRVLNLNYIEN